MLQTGIVILIAIVCVIALAWLRRRRRLDADEWDAHFQGRRSQNLGGQPLAKKRQQATDSKQQRGAQPSSSKPGRAEAILGQKYDTMTECVTDCPTCHHPVMILMPGPPIRGKRAQTINKHKCVHCGNDVLAMTTLAGQMVVGTACHFIEGRIAFENAVALEVMDGAYSLGGGNPRLEAIPLVVGRGRDGQLALLTSEDLGLRLS
jgi:hypothetical protein